MTRIAEYKLKNMEEKNIFYRRLINDDSSTVINFIESQLHTIPKNFFFPPSLTIIEKCLNRNSGISLGAFDSEELVGIRLTYKPGLDKENHGYDLGYSKTELLQVAQFWGTIVNNERRQEGIGDNLVKINCEEIFNNSYSRILATVHPDNLRSIKMLLTNGFSEKLNTIKYNNLPRLIFEKIKVD